MSELNQSPQFKPCYLYFSDGSTFEGKLIGYQTIAVGEVIFNTAMTGYQEIITDPSYAEQIICFTYPHIGNVGINPIDNESNQIYSKGIIIRDYCHNHSNWRSHTNLNDWLTEHKIMGIWDVDTREITKKIRSKGAMNAVIYTKENEQEAKKKLTKFKGLAGLDLAKEVSCKTSYSFNQSLYDLTAQAPIKKAPSLHKVAVLDFGVKHQILKILTSLGCDLTIYPAQTDFQTLKKHNFDGVFLSNGPGDPEPCDYAIKLIKNILDNQIPVFGICLGHQLLALALEAKTIKMKTGHHGANHPVQCLKTHKVLITSQNHGFCVDDESIPKSIEITHRSLFDNTIQGIRHQYLPAYGFQGHPEASPGPEEAREIFNSFISDMKNYQKTKNEN